MSPELREMLTELWNVRTQQENKILYVFLLYFVKAPSSLTAFFQDHLFFCSIVLFHLLNLWAHYLYVNSSKKSF